MILIKKNVICKIKSYRNKNIPWVLSTFSNQKEIVHTINKKTILWIYNRTNSPFFLKNLKLLKHIRSQITMKNQSLWLKCYELFKKKDFWIITFCNLSKYKNFRKSIKRKILNSQNVIQDLFKILNLKKIILENQRS